MADRTEFNVIVRVSLDDHQREQLRAVVRALGDVDVVSDEELVERVFYRALAYDPDIDVVRARTEAMPWDLDDVDAVQVDLTLT